ncbi:MAG: DUF1232 domain-containing protein [Reichenbachiella sp.]
MDKKATFDKYKNKAAEILSDNERVNDLLSKTRNKLKSIVENNEKLQSLSDKVATFYRMLKSKFNGEYDEFPWRTVLLIAGAMLYFITPLDFIPDFIPILGLTDDFAIVAWIYSSIEEDIERFEAWENTIEIEPVDEK